MLVTEGPLQHTEITLGMAYLLGANKSELTHLDPSGAFVVELKPGSSGDSLIRIFISV